MHRTTRVIGHVVTRNEAARYLDAVLDQLEHVADLIIGYDDQSTDETPTILADRCTRWVRRPDHIPSFSDHEAAFRAAAWRTMEALARPTENDWVLCLDADEFLVDVAGRASRDRLSYEIEQAVEKGQDALWFPVDEVFRVQPDGTPLVRTDGFWGQIRACRLARWRRHAQFGSHGEGGGSLPTAWISWACQSEHLRLLHYGYASPTDREEKYLRYAAGRGHSSKHITSIRTPGTLRPWAGEPPWRP